MHVSSFNLETKMKRKPKCTFSLVKENIWQWWNMWFMYQSYHIRFSFFTMSNNYQNLRPLHQQMNVMNRLQQYKKIQQERDYKVYDGIPAIMYADVAIPLIHNIHRDLFAYFRVCTMHLHKPKDFHQLPLDRVE